MYLCIPQIFQTCICSKHSHRLINMEKNCGTKISPMRMGGGGGGKIFSRRKKCSKQVHNFFLGGGGSWQGMTKTVFKLYLYLTHSQCTPSFSLEVAFLYMILSLSILALGSDSCFTVFLFLGFKVPYLSSMCLNKKEEAMCIYTNICVVEDSNFCSFRG